MVLYGDVCWAGVDAESLTCVYCITCFVFLAACAVSAHMDSLNIWTPEVILGSGSCFCMWLPLSSLAWLTPVILLHATSLKSALENLLGASWGNRPLYSIHCSVLGCRSDNNLSGRFLRKPGRVHAAMGGLYLRLLHDVLLGATVQWPWVQTHIHIQCFVSAWAMMQPGCPENETLKWKIPLPGWWHLPQDDIHIRAEYSCCPRQLSQVYPMQTAKQIGVLSGDSGKNSPRQEGFLTVNVAGWRQEPTQETYLMVENLRLLTHFRH